MLEYFKRRRVENYVAQSVNDFQSETAEISGAPEPAFLRAVLYILAATLLTAGIAMSIASVERTVIAPGRVMSTAPTLLMEPLETSVVRQILVTPGQTVRKGDLLATLDPTFSNADLASLSKDESRLLAEIDRLEAEMDDREYIPRTDNADARLQQSIWKIRRAEYQATMSRSRQLMDNARNTIERASEDITHYRARLKLAKDVEFMRKELERKAVGSRLNSLLASDSRVAMSGNLSQAESTIISARNDLAVREAETELFVQRWRGEILKKLMDNRAELGQVQEALSKARLRHSRVELRAQEDAVVLSVARVSPGSVVQAAEKIVTLVPIAGEMFVEVDISAEDQGFLVPGQKVQLKFNAYPFIKHGMGGGILKTVSADSFSSADAAANDVRSKIERFYRGRVEIKDISLRNVPEDFGLVPGMTLMTNIVVGERTIMSYILGGFLRGMAEGVREP